MAKRNIEEAKDTKKEPSYIPPFTITDEITTLVAEIGEIIGRLSVDENSSSVKLRKQNRIKTIQSSPAIENNSLFIIHYLLFIIH